jgi:hypothetical protein
MSASDDVRMHSLNIPPFPLLSEDKSRLSLGINRLAYPREKSLTLEIIRLAQNIELDEEHEDDLPIVSTVYVERKRDGWFSRLYIKKNEDSYDVFLFQKNFDRIDLSDVILQNITDEVKRLQLPFGVTIMDCELCHAEDEGHHHVLRGLCENKIKLYAFDVCVRESNVLDNFSDTYEKRSLLLQTISREGVDQSEGNILSFEKKFSIYWNFRDRTVVDAENKPFIDSLKEFVEKNFPCEGFVLKKWNAEYRFSDPVMEMRNTDMVKFKLEHTDAYVTRVGLKRREVNNASEAVLYDVIVASRNAGEGVCIATVDLDEFRSSTAKSRSAVRKSGAFAVASVKFDVRLKRKDNGTLYVQFVRIVDSDAALECVPINFGPETSVRYSDNVNDSEFFENVSNVERGIFHLTRP